MRNWPLKTPVMGWCLENVTHEVDIETRVKHTSVYVIGQTCGETKRQNYSIDFLVFNNTYNTSVVRHQPMTGVFNGQFLIIKIRFPHLLSIIYRFFCSRRDLTFNFLWPNILTFFAQCFWPLYTDQIWITLFLWWFQNYAP
jgi:hypothetical protein